MEYSKQENKNVRPTRSILEKPFYYYKKNFLRLTCILGWYMNSYSPYDGLNVPACKLIIFNVMRGPVSYKLTF